MLVHAILKYIYLDVLKDKDRLEKNIQTSEKHSTDDYIRAWKIVSDCDYRKIITNLQNKTR